MRKLLRQLFRFALLGLLIILGIVVVKTITFTSKQASISAIAPIPVNDEVLERLALAVRYRTLSSELPADTIPFSQLNAFLKKEFQWVDSLLEHRPVNDHSNIFKWAGRNPKLAPILLLAHLDVVPVEESTLEEWNYPPFSGKRAEGFVWGRGTLDDKSSVMAILEAVELLLREGYTPQRTIYLAFGHDEETRGIYGAKAMAAYFKEQGIHFEYALDEGQVVLEEALTGLSQPLAMIGIAEKGYTTLTLTARVEEAGHSSMPPRETAIGLLSRALLRLEENPFPALIQGASAGLLEYVGPEMSPLYQAVFANLWLTSGIVKRQLSQDAAANAIIRTTTAPTMMRAGVKENVLPYRASAKVNFRILPGDNVQSVIDHVRKVIDDDRVLVGVSEGAVSENPSGVSAANNFGFEVIQRTIHEIFPETVVAPSLVIAFTDSRYYREVTDNIYRFMPVQLDKDDLKRIHGSNERIGEENYKRMIRFYYQLIRNSCK